MSLQVFCTKQLTEKQQTALGFQANCKGLQSKKLGQTSMHIRFGSKAKE